MKWTVRLRRLFSRIRLWFLPESEAGVEEIELEDLSDFEVLEELRSPSPVWGALELMPPPPRPLPVDHEDVSGVWPSLQDGTILKAAPSCPPWRVRRGAC